MDFGGIVSPASATARTCSTGVGRIRKTAWVPSSSDASARSADAVFLMRPTPVEQVRAVAAAGETMPPKSTYFFPKVLTGVVFNPLS